MVMVTTSNLIDLRSSEISKISRLSLSSTRRAPFDPLILEAVISIAGQNQTRNHSLHQFSPPQSHHHHHHHRHHQQDEQQHLDLTKTSIDPLANLRSALQARLSYIPPTSLSSSSTTTSSVCCSARTRIPTPAGQLWLYVYENSLDDEEHLAIVADPASLFLSKSLNDIRHPNESELDRLIRGASIPPPSSLENSQPIIPLTPLVRIHSECFTGETIGSCRCDCGDQLSRSISRILSHPSGGAIIYLRQEGRGIGLSNKLKAYNLQDLGFDTLEANLLLGFGADQRDYRVAASILDDLGLTQIALVTNNPSKVLALQTSGKVKVIERIEIGPLVQNFEGEEELEKYLKTKVLKMGHLIDLPGLMQLKARER